MIDANATDERNLLENQVEELYLNANTANLAILAVAVFLAWVLWPVVDTGALFTWLAYILVITLARTLITLRYRKATVPEFDLLPDSTSEPDDQTPALNARRWLTLYSAGVMLFGLGWGSVILFIVPINATFHLVSAIFVICGLATASAASLASLRHGFAIFSIPALLPGALKLILLNETDTVLMGLFMCAYLIFIAMIALRIHKVILYSLRTQFESAKATVVVQAENEALRARHAELESQLDLSLKIIANLESALQQSSVKPEVVVEDVDRKSKGERFNLLDKLRGGSWDYNLKTGELRFASQWLSMLGYTDADAQGALDFWKSLLHPDECDEVFGNFNAYVNGRATDYFSSHRLMSKTGEWVWVFSRALPIAWGTFGEVLSVVCIEIDIEDPEKHLAGKLSSVNFRADDWLCTEPLFTKRLQFALQTTSIKNVEHALCHVSVFPSELALDPNPLTAGDLSRQLVNVLIRECRHEEPVLDLGNDSFAVLLENHGVEKALDRATALQKVITAHPFTAGKQRVSVNCCIGITPIFDAQRSAAEILEDAEEACTIASNDTPDNLFVFQRENVEYDAGTLERRLLAKIGETLDKKRLLLTATALKPRVNQSLNLGNVFWMTAAPPGLKKNYAFLTRQLNGPSGDNALAVAFDICAIEMFHDWAAAQPRSNSEQGVYIYECRLSSVMSDKFIARARQVYAAPLAARYSLCLAIPEAVYVSNNDAVRAFIDALRPAGIKFALTEFGASAFSYEYMKKLPVDYLKLHDSLIASVESDKTSLLTIQYLNEMGRVLNFKTIAFCSDSERREGALSRIGTDYIRELMPEILSLSMSAVPAASKPAAAPVDGRVAR